MRAQAFAQLGEARPVAREVEGEGHVTRRPFSDQLGEAEVRQEAHADPGDMGISRLGDDRHPHPQGLAGGRHAVVGEGVEGDIDLVVEREMAGGRGDVAVHLQALGGDSVAREQAGQALPRAGIGERRRLEDEPRVGQCQ